MTFVRFYKNKREYLNITVYTDYYQAQHPFQNCIYKYENLIHHKQIPVQLDEMKLYSFHMAFQMIVIYSNYKIKSIRL